MRLIDADSFLAKLQKIVDEKHDEAYGKIADAMRFMIECEATFHAIDAVPVVRCRDCVHYIKHDKRCGTWNHGGIVPYGFCFLGERRTDENNGRT